MLAVSLVSIIHMIAPMLSSHPSLKKKIPKPHHQVSRESKLPRRWCMLTKDNVPKHNKWFGTIEHFPHTLEWFADCWNYLQEESKFEGADVKGGFIIDEHVKKKLQKKYWNRAFFPAMKFPVMIHRNDTEKDEPLDYNLITTKYYEGGWFQRSDICASFRERLWRNLDVYPQKHNKKARRIGILNRNESRAIMDIGRLTKELKKHYKNAHVDVRAFDSEYDLKKEEDTMQMQARWFADKDLIIMAHGAAMSNVIFMKPGSAVLELYPQYYFNDMFWELMAQCGIYHSWYYDGNRTEKYTQDLAQQETDREWSNRMKNKKKNINYDWNQIHSIISLLLKAVDATGR